MYSLGFQATDRKSHSGTRCIARKQFPDSPPISTVANTLTSTAELSSLLKTEVNQNPNPVLYNSDW